MILLSIVFAVLFLFLFIYIYPHLRNEQIKIIQRNQEEIVFNIARQLETDLSRVKDRLMRMVELPEFPGMDIPGQQRIIDDYVRFLQPVSSLYVIDAKGWFVSSSADLSIHTGTSYADRSFFTIPFERGETYFAPPIFFRTGGFIGTSVNVPIQSDTGKRVGVLSGGMRLTELITYVTEYPLPDGTVVFLVDKEGTVVAHSGIDLFALKEGPLSLNFGEHALVQAGKVTEPQEYDREDTRYLGSYVTLESSGWGVVAETPMRLVLAQSHVFAWRLTLVAVIVFAAAFLALLFFARQITLEQKQREEIVRQSEKRYRMLFQDAAEGILVADIGTKKFKYANPAFCKMLGYTEEELQGMGVDDIHPKKDLAHVISEFEAQARGEKTLSLNLPCLRKDGTTVYADINATSALVDGRQCNVGFFTDITERKKAEKTLIQSEKLRALGEMAGGVAHDFNNLLAVILGNAQLLERGLERYGKDEVRRRLAIIARTASQGGETVRRLQHFTHRGIPTDEFTRLDLNEIVRSALHSTSPRWKDEAEAKGVTITVEEKLRKLAPLLGNESELMEVLTNLIFNAVEAMPDGGRITIKTEAKENEVLLYFTDTGQGIPDRIKANVFDPFFTTKGPKASGLGLSTSYGIIKRHKGGMKVESSKGKGTTFTITIPIPLEIPLEKERLKDSEKVSSQKILVIDDEEGVRDVLVRVLADEGHRVTLAETGKKGLGKFKQGDFNLVLTDLGMPDMSGWELAKRIKEVDPKMPVGLITGWAVPLTKKKMKEKGVDFILSKPFDCTEVAKEVNTVLKSKYR